MTVLDLSNISSESRKIINKYLEKSGKTVNAFAKEAGVHPTQLWLFLREQRGLTDTSLQKIGAAIIKSDPKIN
jgi:hypothetical protein